MTNHWADIANATAVVIWGANPSENHPACMAHINRARFPGQFFPGTARANKTPAKLIVIDPRKNRTALQADRFIRIRPGTDIAFGNALMKYIIDQMESPTSTIPAATKTAFFNYLNQTGNGTFFTDGTTGAASTNTTPVPFNSKYTDSRFLVNAAGTDYVRAKVAASTGLTTAAGPDASTISAFPLKSTDINTSVTIAAGDPGGAPAGTFKTVYQAMKDHLAPYTLAEAASICGCTEGDIQYVADAFIANSRCSSTTNIPTDPGYRATTMLYAMGITQHTYGGENVKLFAQIQTLLGNNGRAGGGINALRGIHNVQGSTDMGVLYGNIPGYSGNPVEQYPTVPNAFGRYMDALWGTPLSGSGNKTNMNGSYDDAYNTAAMSLQQRGFWNMTQKWFGDYTTAAPTRAQMDGWYAKWPKGQGDNHITMFRKMIAGTITAAVVWGQNPAVTEPNQGKVRQGLRNLDMLVCVDLFENETAACDRKPTGVTYLIPSCSHVEKAGSATNSGRTLQWRYKATNAPGSSKDDNELLLRFAEALDTAGAFSHLGAGWFNAMYRAPYMGGAASFAAASVSAEITTPGVSVSNPTTYSTTTVTGSEAVAELMYRELCTASASGGTLWIYTNGYSTGRTTNKHLGQADWPVNNRAKSRDRSDPNGTLASPGWGYAWLVNRRVLYNNNGANPGTAVDEVPGDVQDFFMGLDSCSRLFTSTANPPTGTSAFNYPRWYRTIHKLADRPDLVVANTTASPHFVGSISYAGRFPAHTEPYESPDPVTSNGVRSLAKWGRNTKNTAAWDLVPADTTVAGRDVAASTYPLVLTTIRCVEHFQGGPITRNNPYNVEQEPVPWIELNAVDARNAGIKDGDWVKIVTARTDGYANDRLDSDPNLSRAAYGEGFQARVGTGTTENQRVAPGVVAIPWHWGDKGLSTGSRANDLCIDAMDANTTIPEYKACLCRIEKI